MRGFFIWAIYIANGPSGCIAGGVYVCNFNLYKSMFQYEVEMDIILQFMKIFNLCQFGHGYI
jgi:hypothetical protein